VYGALPLLSADAARLEQVFVNLLGNAAHAIPEGAPSEHIVTVTTGRGDDGAVVISIRDTGDGIPAAAAGRVFDPFFTTRPLVGAGLGLTTALAIVRGMGGSITVDGAEGRGTVFTVQLPRPKLENPPRPGVARVLLVERDRRVGEALRRAIGKDQDVWLASTAHEALEILERGEFDLVLCDVMLSDSSGLELFERLEQRRPELAARFVFMSGTGLGSHMKALLEQSARPVLQKPIDVKELRRFVRERSR
jgi:CheY-like chemotaxis protein